MGREVADNQIDSISSKRAINFQKYQNHFQFYNFEFHIFSFLLNGPTSDM